MSSTGETARRTAQRAKHSESVEWLGRAGLLAKGVLYGIVGLLAIQIPLGMGGKATDRQGALRTVAAQPFGEVLLVVLGIGLLGYGVWSLVQAVLDRGEKGDDAKGLAKRAGYFGRGLLYLGTAGLAFALVVGAASGGSNEKEETANVLQWPLGRWIVGLVGLAILGAGLFNLYRALTRKFRKDLHEHELGGARPWAIAVGVVGHAARGVVFGLIGVFLLKAAVEYDPSEAVGIDGALRKLAQQPSGPWLLGLVAAGLLAYALFCGVQARYREV